MPRDDRTTEVNASTMLRDRKTGSVSEGVRNLHPVYLDRALNAEAWDVDGNRYIDFVGGIGVLTVGHRHPVVMDRVAKQCDRFTHSCFNALPHEPYVAVTDWLAANCPIEGPAKSMLTNSGAEAMENALKLARGFTGRTGVIAFEGGFHGRTLATLALTGKTKPYKTGLGPLPGPVWHLPYPCPETGVSVEGAMEAINRLFSVSADVGSVGAIVIEPVQGEGGFRACDAAFLIELRRLCDANGMVLIADEIQSGFARTGKMFAMEHAGVAPDILVMGKGIGGGFPLAAITGAEDVMNALAPGGLGGTYSGNPVACAAATGVFDVLRDEKILLRAKQLGEKYATHIAWLRDLPGGHVIGNMRGIGAMRAFEIIADDGTPSAKRLQTLLQRARANGLLLMPSGEHANVVRLLAPLTIPFDQVDEAFAIIGKLLPELAGIAD
ncbi:aspartate aminotransferase family protein [Thalassospira lucentensis]|uniref:4-aminobutyrate aminotransferase n=3 Tax=Thalassospira lucentensis TaxID=168935 RepID=A0A358HW22_9PROT|nr:aminotransferase class III-fold pyridoxal phosphate-dependent enzyme [Thalassospira lucentensis]HBU99376.1 4-aminobutyrate aminotransferase [Thalassospira lucentensis]